MVLVINRMVLIALVLCSISGSLAQQSFELEEESLGATACPMYKCKTSSQKFKDDTCLYYVSADGATTYYGKECSNSNVCTQDVAPSMNWTCTTPTTATNYALIGEYCKKDSDCMTPYSSKCSSNKCQASIKTGDSCYNTATNMADHKYCPAGDYCKSTAATTAVCTAQAKLKEACTAEYQCVNGAWCNSTATAAGTCIQYLSIPAGGHVASCGAAAVGDYAQNMACASGWCTMMAADKYLCIDAVKSSKSTPQTCTNTGAVDTTNCVSTKDSVSGATLNSMCTCGWNNAGTAYCALFSGDSLSQSYLKYFAKWIQSSDITNCNTAARFNSNCQRAQWSSSNREAYQYYDLYVGNYALVYGSEDCYISAGVPAYKAAKDAYNGSSATMFTLSALVFAAFA